MNRINIDMDLLRTFVMGVRLGSFSKAAARIGRTQSAISLQIRRLEQQVGAVLFYRDGRGLSLNDDGKTLFNYAERLLDLNDEAIEVLAKKEVEGEVRLGIPPDLAETWLPQMLARFSRLHPGVQMEARVDRNASLLQDIAEHRLDVALVWARGTLDEKMPGEHVTRLPMSWIGAEDSLHVASERLPLVLMGEPCLFRAHGLAALQSADVQWRVAFTSSSLAGLWAATSAGLGITIRTPAALPQGLHVLTGPALPDLGMVDLRLHITEQPTAAIRHFASLLIETVRETF